MRWFLRCLFYGHEWILGSREGRIAHVCLYCPAWLPNDRVWAIGKKRA